MKSYIQYIIQMIYLFDRWIPYPSTQDSILTMQHFLSRISNVAKRNNLKFINWEQITFYNPYATISTQDDKQLVKYYSPIICLWNRELVTQILLSSNAYTLRQIITDMNIDIEQISPHELYMIYVAFDKVYQLFHFL
jgi:hypothetical protein